MGLNNTNKLPQKEKQQLTKQKQTGMKQVQKYQYTASKFIPHTKNEAPNWY